jgi:hypothetical protein
MGKEVTENYVPRQMQVWTSVVTLSLCEWSICNSSFVYSFFIVNGAYFVVHKFLQLDIEIKKK